MALSPADFAAYSRATGAPYPESPQERAELAPEVLAFRRGQLAQPEQQSNLPAILGGTVLGLGALGAALAGTRRFARGTKTQSTPQRDLGIVRQAATGRTSGTTAPRTPAPPTPGTPPSSEGVAPSRVAAIPQATVDLTTIKQQEQPNVIKQQVEANDTGIDQINQKQIQTPAQRQVNGFTAFSQQADKISAQVAAQKAAQDALAVQKSKSPVDAKSLQNLGPKYGLGQDEIFERIMASASDYKPGSMKPLTELDRAALLDPQVPTSAVQDLLGTNLTERGGRVGRNLDYEAMAEGGGITEREPGVFIGEEGSDVLAYNPRTGQYEADYSNDIDLETTNMLGGRGSDYERNAADYGDVEGPGGFVSTRGFKERTNTGSTIVPGEVQEASAFASGSERQERSIDRVIPARETLEGDPSSGLVFDPTTGRAMLVGTGQRNKQEQLNLAGKPIRVVDASTGRARTLGQYQGKITVDDPSYDPTSGGNIIGRYQPATSEPSPKITTQPVTAFLSAKERLIQDEKGNWYVNQRKTKNVGEEALTALVGSNPYPQEISLDRKEVNNVLQDAKNLWNATKKETDTNALDFQTYLIDSLDGYLQKTKGIKLTVLQPGEKGRLSSAAFDFIKEVQPGLKETNLYVLPAKTNPEGRPLVSRTTSRRGQVRETPLIAEGYEEMQAVPLPGKTRVSGAGAISAQEVDTSTYEGNPTFFSPRIETAPQRRVMQQGQSFGIPASSMIGATSNPIGVLASPLVAGTPTGNLMSILRGQMETKPVGYKVKSPGSFARTQNPYTGAAAPAMGPASRVLSGNYQYPQQQLQFNLGGQTRYVSEVPSAYVPPPQQLEIEGASGFSARQRQSPADIAATQLEDYMSKLQRGRSTPLTSQAVIQPRLF